MIFNTFSSLLLLVFLLFVVFKFYNNLIYPILQFLKKKNEHGYILLGVTEYEHRAKVEKIIGRKLSYNEEIHHINGKKWDNRKSNLALMIRESHIKWHERLAWMYENKIFPSIKTQRKKLIEDFNARLF